MGGRRRIPDDVGRGRADLAEGFRGLELAGRVSAEVLETIGMIYLQI